MPARRSDESFHALERRVVALVKEWYEEATGQDVRIGIANGGLILIEHFRRSFPLAPNDYVSKRGSQVRGLSGRTGDEIIARFLPGMCSIGTEAGRTSRGTLPAVRRLADSLNDLAPLIEPLTVEERGRLADAMQRWIVENPIRAYFERQKLAPPLDARHASPANVTAILAAAADRNQAGPVAQHIIGAKLALRYPGLEVENYSYSTADAPTNRHGDFVVGDTVFHVTMTPSPAVIEKCERNTRDGYRPLLLVPDSKREGASQMAESMGLGSTLAVMGIETFVGQNVEEVAGFNRAELESQWRRLLEIYNERVGQAETDPSLQIEIPSNLGRSG